MNSMYGPNGGREGGGVSIIPAVIFRNSQIMRVN
jgi:hypothetical protein